ncbi:MAG: hypothetical protein JWN86_1520 [Planctomycetota bacterium]|nr:hypothetical protein [Planctomycetota bacterium]
MPIPPPPWGFLGLFAGPWKFLIVAALALAFYGRRISPYAARWLSTTSRRPGPSRPQSRFSLGDRVYVFLLVLAVTALVTWIVTRMTIVQTGRG